MVLLHEFILTADRVVSFEARFPHEKQTVTTLPYYKNKLQQLWEDTENSYTDFLASNQDVADSDEVRSAVAAVEEKYASVFETYVHFMSRMVDMINSLTVQPAFPGQAADESLEQPTPGVHRERPGVSSSPNNFLFGRNLLSNSALASSTSHPRKDDHMNNFTVPPCNIDDFHGNHGTWPTFRDLFTAMFINNSRLSDVERLFHLVHRTKGEAHDIVAKVPLTNAGFTTAWQQLTAAYENKRLLMTEQMTLLHSLPIVTQESETSIKSLQRGINNCLATITHHDISIVNWDPFLVFQCCQRLPKTTIELWEQKICNKKDVITWKELDTFLTERATTLKSIAGTRNSSLSIPKPKLTASTSQLTSKSHHTHVEPGKKAAAVTNTSNSAKTCPVCDKRQHNIRSCEIYRGFSSQERWNKVKSLRLCFNCLSNSHSVDNCSSTFNCATCHQRHHTSLHGTKAPLKSYLTSVYMYNVHCTYCLCENPNL